MPSFPAQMTGNSSVLHLKNNANEDILKQHTCSDDMKLYCIQYMRDETRSFAYTRAVLRELDLGARREVERLGGNKGLISILDRLRIESGEECVI
jgi:geranylgeranyl diphosphate synthase type 3